MFIYAKKLYHQAPGFLTHNSDRFFYLMIDPLNLGNIVKYSQYVINLAYWLTYLSLFYYDGWLERKKLCFHMIVTKS
jgi:hypothetical protein